MMWNTIKRFFNSDKETNASSPNAWKPSLVTNQNSNITRKEYYKKKYVRRDGNYYLDDDDDSLIEDASLILTLNQVFSSEIFTEEYNLQEAETKQFNLNEEVDKITQHTPFETDVNEVDMVVEKISPTYTAPESSSYDSSSDYSSDYSSSDSGSSDSSSND